MSEDIPDLPPSPINDGITPVGEMDEFGEEQSSSDIADFDLELAEDREEHTSELQSHSDLVCRLLLEKKKNKNIR